MNPCERIHETVVRDIVDILSGIKDSDEVSRLLARKSGTSFKSINTATSGLILVFPVLCTKTIQIANAAMITKAIERRATTLLQMLFSAISLGQADNAIDYVKSVHTNLFVDDKMSIDSFIDTVDKFAATLDESTIDRELYESVKEDLKNLNYFLPNSISESSINDYKIYPNKKFGNTSILNERRAPNSGEIDRENQERINKVFATQIVNSEVKKANELEPTKMVIHFSTIKSDKVIPMTAVVGVKAKLYTLDSDDIISRIKLKNEDANGFNRFIRAATREISFWKDLVFAIDKAKLDAISNSKRGSSSKFWKVLERRAIKSRLRRSLGNSNDASAITTLVLSAEEAEYLKKTENIDVGNPSTIRPIMEAYNLMGVVIVNESMEVANFIFDTGDDNYEAVSFNHLEREASDNSYKKVINLMTKMSR